MKSKVIGALASLFGWQTIADSAKWIAAMGRRVSPFHRRHGRQETFDAAVQRVGADEQSLAANRRNFAVVATVHGLATVAACGFAASAFLNDGNGLAWLGFAAVNGALAFTFAFRHWQIRRRRLGSVAEFLRDAWRLRSGR